MHNTHTKGPWVHRPDPSSNSGDHPCGDYVIGVGDDIDSVAVTSPLANARLIAAAPELLEALIELVRQHKNIRRAESYPTENSPATDAADAAIAKATGGQP